MKPSLRLLSLVLTLAACVSSAHAQTPQRVLGISEGTSGGLDHAQVVVKYEGLANAIGRAIKANVSVVFVREFKALEEGMKSGRLDFVMARPSDYPARGMRDYGYKYVSSAKPDGRCLIIVPKDSPLQKLADMKGKRLAMPEQVSFMSRFCTAELREQGIDIGPEQVQYVREQAAVTFYLKNKFADVGAIASYSGPAKKLDKDGMRVLHESITQPYFPLIANNEISAAQVKAIQAELVALPDSPGGPEVLKRIGIERFDVESEKRMRDLLKWLQL